MEYSDGTCGQNLARNLSAFSLALALSLIPGSARAESAGDGRDVKPAQDATPAPDRSVGEVIKDVWTRDTLLGDWGGLRTDVHDHGIDVGLRLSQFYQSVASGGRDTNSEYGGIMDYRLNIDGQKLFGLWEGVSLQLHATTRFGEDVNADAGDLSLINAGMLYPAPGDYHDTKITHFAVTQNLFGGRAQAFAGKLNVVDLMTGFFPQIAGGLEGFWGVQTLMPALPWFRFVNLSQWGGGAWTINEETKMVEHGFLVIGQENTSTENFTKLKSSFDDGVAMLAWIRLFWKLDELPGYFLLFGGGSTKKYQSNDPHDWHFVPGQGLANDNGKKEPWDIAWYFYQDFWQAQGDPTRHAGIFFGASTGNDDPNFSQSNAFLTVEAFGPMASRPKDRMGVAAFYSSFTDDYKDLTDDLGIELRDMWGFELYYNIEINKWLHLTPDLQLLENEWRGDDFAIIPGVRLVTDF
jgi:porin